MLKSVSVLCGAGVLLAGVLFAGGPAFAGSAKKSVRLPAASEIRPLPDSYRRSSPGSIFHDVRLSLDFGYGYAERRGSPSILKGNTYSPTLGLSFGIGDFGFAGLSTSYEHHAIQSNIASFNLPVGGRANVYGIDGVLGVTPLPFIRFGVLGGYGGGGSSYSFTGFNAAPIGSNAQSARIGGFAGASYAVDNWLFNGDVSVIRTDNRTDFDPGNTPARAAWGSTLALVQLGVSYQATDQLRLSTGVVFNHFIVQTVAGNEPKLSPNWVTLQVGVNYDITQNWEVNAKALTWVGNSSMNYTRASLGVAYKF